MKNVLSLLILFFYLSCGQDALKQRERKLGSLNTKQNQQCNCGFENEPVCANDGKTYNNSCQAICHGASDYSEGACLCNSNSGYICGQPPMPECPEGTACAQVLPPPKTYSDECELVRNNARFLNFNVCP